jgi:hypothetical protein
VPTESPAALATLRDAREEAITRLSDAFAHDVIDLDEFERRLTIVHRATTPAEVASTVTDLPGGTTALAALAVPALVPAPVPTLSDYARDTDSLMAIVGGIERHGQWTVPRHLKAVAVLGGMVLDLREASFSRGVTEIEVKAVLGGAQIIVPPGLAVEVSGSAILGGIDHVDRMPVQLDPERPVLRVRGFAVLGGVAVETRLPGESEADAHRRRVRGPRALGPASGPKRLPGKTTV